ncbi:amidohydrolase family protein [Pseudomonas gingeri]|uniref:Amidohydrolase family protein n=1 Tax=Pseudomonas gingeri TaxID=117681 RepID=A0A7Y8CJL3_9PSED|nr:amidohydrolase family protein [Pseudomonas gingeri]NWA04388.1 amidohydrolase family protein [Pseudomonas gingeri]NWA15635.1 amidohydrolase family protein [Pseudomonas gingeri]NWA58193.1 amidohydrolase family protein [Pseudomonas gingeri]NWA96131.1 amidohydrolase family protein [Pseudomonas gingeri]NWB04930.1 amidohydrolase family protein [Pseudomonas gingeri]
MSEICPLPISGIDAHAHVFERGLGLATGRRYAPDYDATLADYLACLQENGLSHGVLVQPSFLGTDNSYLLAALQQAAGRLRGVVVVERDIALEELQRMAGLGVAGVRLNLMGQPLPDFALASWQVFFQHLRRLDWHVEVHRQLEDLPALIQPLLEQGCRVVVDHFGRPDARLGVEQPAFARLLALGESGRLWIKVSAIYRLGGTPMENLHFAEKSLSLMLQTVGPDRLLWGSDWPHTQHEQEVDFASEFDRLRHLACAAPLRQHLLCNTAAELFGFVRD